MQRKEIMVSFWRKLVVKSVIKEQKELCRDISLTNATAYSPHLSDSMGCSCFVIKSLRVNNKMCKKFIKAEGNFLSGIMPPRESQMKT